MNEDGSTGMNHLRNITARLIRTGQWFFGATPRCRRSRRFLQSQTSGVAAVEFALIFPILSAILGGIIEINHAVTASRKLALVAYSIGDMIAQNSTTTLRAVDYKNYWYTTILNFPQLLQDTAATGNTYWTSLISVDVSYININNCTVTSCTSPTAVRAWNIQSDASGLIGTLSPCYYNSYTSVANSGAQSLSTLPASAYTPNPVIRVTVVYQYTPYLFASMFGSSLMQRSAYFTPRNVTSISLSSTSVSNSRYGTYQCT